jgi:hypothetical protein
MNLQITAVIDLVDRRQRMKIRRGSGRAQFVSFNFPNNLIWAIESSVRDGCYLQPGRTRRCVVRATAQSGIFRLRPRSKSTLTRFLRSSISSLT